jgi:hypothetical protein
MKIFHLSHWRRSTRYSACCISRLPKRSQTEFDRRAEAGKKAGGVGRVPAERILGLFLEMVWHARHSVRSKAARMQ